ncbi:MAG: C25 family cysteine peptidase, partial [candidate division WOR-3 bacterium]
TTPLPTKRWIRERLLEHGFNTVDTVFFPMPPSQISTSINQGVIFVNYRSGEGDPDGWPWPDFRNDDVNALSNGWMLPIVTSITCFTGHFGYSTCFGEAWLRAGNPVTPRGAVGFFGSASPSTHSRWNNCLDHGVYWAFANENISDLGPALYRGKMEVYTNFPGDTSISSGSSFYFHTFNLLGDPSLSVWTDVPDTFQVTHNSSMSAGGNFLSVTVTNAASQPVDGAMVSLYKDGEVKEVAFTDLSGYVDFNFATSTQDTLFVTVTKQNHKPYQGFCIVNNSAVYVDHDSHTISDPGGNNNGEVNPGETIQLGVTLKNYGNSTTATSVSARISTSDPLITVTDSLKSFGSISPGATASAAPFVFDVSTNARHNNILKFDLTVTSNQGTWAGTIWITVKDANLSYQWNQVLDANGILEPSETSDFVISIENIGGLVGNNIWGTLGSHNDGVTVTDSIGYFADIPIGDSATNSSNHFTLSANSQLTPGTIVRFSMILTGDNGLVDTIGFRLTVGIVDSSEPFGPDDYGYFAYDDTDVGYDEKPDYNWIEVDPNHGGPGDSLILDNDETITMSLPFSFKYYGNWYNDVSISSNGYIAMGTTSLADIYNWAIPAAGGPPLLIAPFWDDLDPVYTDSSGNVSYWHDATNHRFIIEYSRIQHVHDPVNPTPGELQTFEVILYDPQHYTTQTGDGEILFQYMDITNDDVWHNYATVGIEDYGHTTGLEYTFANSYPDAAAPLANSRAIKFTTDPPDTFTGITEFKNRVTTDSWLEISPNPFFQITDIRYGIIDENPGNMELKIFDVSGRLVRDFSDRLSVSGHPSSVRWDGRDDVGKRAPEGIYFVRLQGPYLNLAEKVILVE